MSPRGGARTPSDKTPRVSGPGANSRRTDNQPVNVGRVGDSEDLTHGDRQRLEESVKRVPIRNQSSPQVATAPRGLPGQAPLGGGSDPFGAEPPLNLVEMPTNRPDEPITEGSPFGPGAGPEALQTFQEPTEKQMLARYLASRPGASPRWQAVLSGVDNENRPPEVAPPPLLASEPEIEPEPEFIDVPEDDIEDEPPSEAIPAQELPPEGDAVDEVPVEGPPV